MKNYFVLIFIFLFSIGFSAQAKLSAQIPTSKTAQKSFNQSFSSCSDRDRLADEFVGCGDQASAGKIRNYRSLNFISLFTLSNLFEIGRAVVKNEFGSDDFPAFSLKKFLLFPNHYFW